MLINIHTSEKNLDVVRRLTRKLPHDTTENVIARIALGYSLFLGKKFTPEEFNIYDSRGKEYKDHVLLGTRYRSFFIALICQHYHLKKTDEKHCQIHQATHRPWPRGDGAFTPPK